MTLEVQIGLIAGPSVRLRVWNIADVSVRLLPGDECLRLRPEESLGSGPGQRMNLGGGKDKE